MSAKSSSERRQHRSSDGKHGRHGSDSSSSSSSNSSDSSDYGHDGPRLLCTGGAFPNCADVPCRRANNPPAFPCKDPWRTGSNIIGVLFCDGRFRTLLRALEIADLLDYLANADSVTLFAPTDDAFADLPEDVLEALLADPNLLRDVLLYHVLEGGRTVLDLTRDPPMELTTLQGNTLTVDLKGPPTRTVVIDALDREATIIDKDLWACNGVVQVINKVLLPYEVPVPPVAPVAAADNE